MRKCANLDRVAKIKRGGERRGKRPEGEKYSNSKKETKRLQKEQSAKENTVCSAQESTPMQKIFAEKNLGKVSESAKNKGLKKKRRKERGEEIAVRNSLIGIINQKNRK